jgi:hypothetical protein
MPARRVATNGFLLVGWRVERAVILIKSGMVFPERRGNRDRE